ncbi:MAG: TrbG/VirB9 family P-type conjugative transfer protein [Pseudomonadota bacterium]|nr:TrbG/VirB9 family P-type conjugative transfer protein [Pseudomonadota bacterium]
MNHRTQSRGRLHAWGAAAFASCALLCSVTSAETVPAKGSTDSRIRVATYNGDEVYKLRGFVGYQIDLEFEPGETFTGLGAGDLEGLSFVGQDNHLFLKPKAAKVATNLTVLTSRRNYQFDYTASVQTPLTDDNVIYALRFMYLPPAESTPGSNARRVDTQLQSASAKRAQNTDYWYCGHPALRPVATADDGVHTRLQFGANSDLPAIFVRNDDGSESLLNFSMEGGDVIVHRVAKQLILRRGRLRGCVVNKKFAGGGTRLNTGTVAPDVERRVQGSTP